jgi:hypothetical protein
VVHSREPNRRLLLSPNARRNPPARGSSNVRTVRDDAASRLDEYLAEHTEQVRTLARDSMAMAEARLRGATRMLYVNFNATVIAYSPDGKSRHAVCSVVAYRSWVNLCFFSGPELPDPHRLLQGTGSTVRSVRIKKPADLDSRVSDLLEAAIEMWSWAYDPERPISTTIASVSDKRQPLS